MRLLVALVLLSGGVSDCCSFLGCPNYGYPDPPIRVHATIEVMGPHPDDPHLLDFGEVHAGSPRTLELSVRNVGSDTLQIQDVVLPASDAFSAGDSYAMLLAPDRSTVIPITFDPPEDRVWDGDLVVRSNDREQPEVFVAVRADGRSPRVVLEPESFDFGLVRVYCCGGTVDVQIRNTGRDPACVYDLRYVEPGGTGELIMDPGVLYVDGDPATVDFCLAPGEAERVTVWHLPTDLEPDWGFVQVISDTPGETEAGQRAWQRGQGYPGPTHTDAFVQRQDPTDTFPLTDRPVPETLVVWLEGVPLPVGWSFDPALNAIVFDPEELPPAGWMLQVEYQTWIDCCG